MKTLMDYLQEQHDARTRAIGKLVSSLDGKSIPVDDVISKHGKYIPSRPCVYFVQDGSGSPIYIGASAYGPRQRIRQHLTQKSDLGEWLRDRKDESATITVWYFPTRADALLAESEKISQHAPILNRR